MLVKDKRAFVSHRDNKQNYVSHWICRHKAPITPKMNAGAAMAGATRRCVYGWDKLPHQRAKVMETTRGLLLFITASTLFQSPLMYWFTFLL